MPLLRTKLGLADGSSTRYDADVAAAVRKFQASADIKATGVLDDATVRAMNSPKRDRQIDTVARQHGALALAAAPARRVRRSATPMSS